MATRKLRKTSYDNEVIKWNVDEGTAFIKIGERRIRKGEAFSGSNIVGNPFDNAYEHFVTAYNEAVRVDVNPERWISSVCL